MISETLALGWRSLTKWTRNPFAVIATSLQALFWLALFGNSFNPANALQPSAAGSLGPLQQAFGGAATYITFLTPGVISIVALTGMSFMGVDLVFDRVNGYLDVLRAFPIPRTSIYFGGVIQNVVKGMVAAPITFLIALAVPDGLKFGQGFGVLNLAGVFATTALLTIVFSTFFTGIAISVKSTDSFFAAVNFLTFPIMFTSTAFFPLGFFPGWLKPIAQVNPISLASDAMRLLVVNGSLSGEQTSAFIGDWVGLLVFGIMFAIIGIVMARNALKAR
ncbi:MAG TPA: ABC transporter permease [Nitrososphaerales archaeon]|nr:ABC transporter permease [Nitrososphaerales archaeon]